MTVKQWRKSRFARSYPGFTCEILDAKGKTVHGGTLLQNVRDTYFS